MSVDLGMTVKEAAAELGCSGGTVYELCASGRLPHRRVGVKGKQIRITRAHIDRYVSSCERDETNAPGAAKAPLPGAKAKKFRRARIDSGSGRPDGKPLQHIK